MALFRNIRYLSNDLMLVSVIFTHEAATVANAVVRITSTVTITYSPVNPTRQFSEIKQLPIMNMSVNVQSICVVILLR